MQGIAILANEHLVPSKCRNCLSAKQATVENSLSIARVLRHFVLVPCEICVKKLLLTGTMYLSRIEKVRE